MRARTDFTVTCANRITICTTMMSTRRPLSAHYCIQHTIITNVVDQKRSCVNQSNIFIKTLAAVVDKNVGMASDQNAMQTPSQFE